jgi:hypothetical protein
MKKLLITVVAGIFASSSYLAIAADDMKSGKGMMMGNMMKKMDTDNDGMLSKEEFMSGHEMMFDRMKGENGMIALSDKQMCCGGMMGHGDMKGHEGMKNHEGMKDQGSSR